MSNIYSLSFNQDCWQSALNRWRDLPGPGSSGAKELEKQMLTVYLRRKMA
jgi:hypothetical protein